MGYSLHCELLDAKIAKKREELQLRKLATDFTDYTDNSKSQKPIFGLAVSVLSVKSVA